MCNAYNLKTRLASIGEVLARYGLPLVDEDPVDFNLTDDVYPGVDGLILRPADPLAPAAGVTAGKARWGLIPFYHRKPLKEWKFSTNNAKVETCSGSGVFKGPYARRRCLVPFDGFYEWTGPKGRKTKHLISPTDGQIRSFAGLWDRAETEDGVIESYTIITCPPGPDAARYHTRQPVILDPEHWKTWLDLSRDPADLLKGSLAGDLIADPPDPVPG